MQKYDKYDIIIENITKEISSMIDNNENKKWETPEYSKSEINKAGKIISDENSSNQDRNNAINVLNNWRASHAYPLQVICSNLRRTNSNAIVVQRLKRLESILGKIKRFPEMQLYKMQDLGGCRVILNNIEQVYASVERYKKSRIRHILKREYDYIKNPKSSGNRSYHMVYQFHSDKKDTYNKNMLIEIQFRTKLQHIWATAVEMMGIYTNTNLKSSQGNDDILRFFTLISSVFAIKEGCPVCPNTSDDIVILKKEIQTLDRQYKIISTLQGLNVAINYDETKIKRNKKGYYILTLDYAKKILNIKFFQPSQTELATRVYGEIEKKENINVVLVSANSFTTLRAAYPNYFVDIAEFINIAKTLIVDNEN